MRRQRVKIGHGWEQALIDMAWSRETLASAEEALEMNRYGLSKIRD